MSTATSTRSDQQPLVRPHQQETDDYGATNTNDDDEEEEEEEEPSPAALLTLRLRILFAIVTWPILPLGILTLLALLWFFYAEVLDFHRHCAQPLQPYAVVTVLWMLYLACAHSPVRERLAQWVGTSLQTTNEASLPRPRPPVVRRYDQLVQTVGLLYVYAGMTLVQTCRNLDTINTENMNNSNTTATMEYNDTTDVMTCDATCPNLFPALAIYVTVLQVFTLSLIFPLLFLPCIYLWFLRHATVHYAHDDDDDDLFASLRHELLDSSQPTVQQVLEQALQDVQLVQMAAEETATGENELRAVPTKRQSTTATNNTSYPTGGVRECCICMNDFVVQQCHDVEMGVQDTSDNDNHQAIVRTLPCGHLFHRKCMTNWVRGGFQQQQHQRQADWRRGPARRTSCPLCRTELCQTT